MFLIFKIMIIKDYKCVSNVCQHVEFCIRNWYTFSTLATQHCIGSLMIVYPGTLIGVCYVAPIWFPLILYSIVDIHVFLVIIPFGCMYVNPQFVPNSFLNWGLPDFEFLPYWNGNNMGITVFDLGPRFGTVPNQVMTQIGMKTISEWVRDWTLPISKRWYIHHHFDMGDPYFDMGIHALAIPISKWWSPFCFFLFGDLHVDMGIHAYVIPVSKQWSLFWFFKMVIPISIWGLMLSNLVIPISIWAFLPMQSLFQNSDHHFSFLIWGSPFQYGDS